MQKAMTKVSKKLQDKLEVLKDNKHAIKLWKLYKKYYKKNYTSTEEEHERLGKFIDNLKLIIQENFRFDEGHKSFRMQLNQFGDMNLDEFRRKLTGLNADGQGEKNEGEVTDESTSTRRRRSLVDFVKKKVKDKIKKKLFPSSSSSSKTQIHYGSNYYSSDLRPVLTTRRPISKLSTKATVDYRPHMNPIENQGQCGSVYLIV